MRTLVVLTVLGVLMGGSAYADDKSHSSLEQDFDGLGGNQALLEKARALNPEIATSIVQPREVQRRMRFEFAPEFSGAFGGDTYSRAHSLGLNAQFHINPRWSVGVKYNHSFNRLTAEGQNLVDRALEDYQANPSDPSARLPNLDYPLNETLALVNWYPFYGKLNLLDKAVAQFDVYAVLGGGSVTLRSGTSDTFTGGMGIAFWMRKNLSTRFEVRYQRYQAQYDSGPQDLDVAVGGLQVGWLL